ncbi:major histocompatibility complex class I-related gene protein-like [Pleurodeles waltl]|uniref:major histocompatibility complex class I-related gene protein-like n=1 Tax=Pleurodeles waltl TaxID=8319 RepID=UPI0037098153
MVAYVGDVPIEGYNSETKRLEPKVTWMEKKHRLYWLWEGEGLQLMESVLTEEVKAMMRKMNHTAGLHTLQKMYGCELGENGSRTWFYHEAYDGENLLSLNGDSVTYKADTHPATIILERWMAKKIMIQQLKDYLENPCLSHLQRYLKDGAESLQRVTPRIMSCRMKNGAHTYYCGNVYGFHPREIEVKWFRDGLEIHTDFMEILPNPDGTFQLRTTVEVQEGDMKTYRYQVDHSSLPEPVTMQCEARSTSKRNIYFIIRGVSGGLLLLLLVISVCIFCQGIKGRKMTFRQCSEGGMVEPSPMVTSSLLNLPPCSRTMSPLQEESI